MAAAAAIILSTPGWEQPTTMTRPSGVLMASDSSRNSSVPGLSETSAIRWMSGAISAFFSTSSKLPPGHADPKRITSGGAPL